MKKALCIFALGFSLSAPTFAADPGQGRGRGQGPNGGPVFNTQGECQSQVIQLRNAVRRGTSVNLPGSGVNVVCKLITRGPLQGLFELVNLNQ